MSLSFIACSSEPKSVEELKKLSDDELQKMVDDKNCEFNMDDQECQNIVQARRSKALESQEYTPIKPKPAK